MPKDVADSKAAEVEDVTENGDSSKKKSKKKKGKSKAINQDGESIDATKLPPGALEELLKKNPTLGEELKDMPPSKAEETLKALNLGQLLTGMTVSGTNEKDLAQHKYWSRQPVVQFGEKVTTQGLIRQGDISKVPKEASPLIAGFEWVTVDLNDTKQLEEVYQLLSAHYVEDKEAMFRFNYSSSFFNWALKSPEYDPSWHIGVRASESKKLVAFISAIPIKLRLRKETISCSEVNFLCVHKKLRTKRLAPVLITEITRKCNLSGTLAALYSAGKLLPTPVSACRYYHRSLNWSKLHAVGFSPMPPGSTVQRQMARFALPKETSLEGWREMTDADVPDVTKLLKKYFSRFDIVQDFSEEEVSHWILQKNKQEADEKIVWAYVVENGGQITDFVSFYSLSSTVIGHAEHTRISVAYLFYYATVHTSDLKHRLNALINDMLVVANNNGFDVFNALTLQDNNLFLEKQKFGPGDGYLHYYMFNYRVEPIRGGVDKTGKIDDRGSGVGVVML